MPNIVFTSDTKTLMYPPPVKNSYLAAPLPRQFNRPAADGNSYTVTYADSLQRFQFTLENLTDDKFDELIAFLEGQNFSEQPFSFTDPKRGRVWPKVKYMKGIETAVPQANGFIRVSLVLQQQF